MKIRLCICAVVFIVSCFPEAQQITQEQAFTAVTSFKTIACKGAFNEPMLINSRNGVKLIDSFEINDPELFFDVFHGDGECTVLKSTGQINFYKTDISWGEDGFPSNIKNPNYPFLPVLPQSTVIQLAQQYINSAGWPGTYLAHSVNLYVGGGIARDHYMLDMRKVVNGVSIENPIELSIEPTTGTLMNFLYPVKMTLLPTNLVPGISANAARTSILEKLLALSVIDSIEVDPVELQAALPLVDVNDPNCTFTTDDQELARIGQGKLLYHAAFKLYENNPKYYEFWVDANTSEVKYFHLIKDFFVEQQRLNKGVGGPYWNWGQGLISVLRGKTESKVKFADIEDVNITNGPIKGVSLFLNRGRMNRYCQFDPKSGLVWFSRGSSVHYGKPNDALLKMLRQVAPKTTPAINPKR